MQVVGVHQDSVPGLSSYVIASLVFIAHHSRRTVVSNMAATPPGSEGIFPLSLPGERPDKTTLNLNWVNCSR
jgi:hypothetical protein